MKRPKYYDDENVFKELIWIWNIDRLWVNLNNDSDDMSFIVHYYL